MVSLAFKRGEVSVLGCLKVKVGDKKHLGD